jgi:H+-transporting ATPase
MTVAAIPVALPAVLSVTMAVGAVRLARRKAIFSRLVAIEELAGMDLLCSDKTGTLTQNRLVPEQPVMLSEHTAQELILYAALASRREDRDPIDQAIFDALDAGHGSLEGWTLERFQPFDPVSKRTQASVVRGAQRLQLSKGAPQAILELVKPSEELRARALQSVDQLADSGYRTLGVAAKEDGGKWELLGMLPLFDPPREDSAETVKAITELGVTIKMVTGDHPAIATQIARKLRLGRNICTADRLQASSASPLRDEDIERADGFAGVFPEHKFRIVEALQRLGHFVGMTGDGVNDAPALKRADVGIAVAGATDAARGAADLILTAPGLSVIADAIRESRRIFRRMNSYAIFRIAETIRVLLFMTASILVFNFYPVTAVMIIILALLNDGPIMMIAYDKTNLPERPTRWDMGSVLSIAAVLGVMGVFASFLLFWIGQEVLKLDRATIQTLMFLKLTVAGHLTIYLARTGDKHFWARPLPAPALLGTAEVNQMLATLVAAQGWLMAPIGWHLALLVWGYALTWFLLSDVVKVLVFRLISHQASWESKHVQRAVRPLHASGHLIAPR